MIVPIWKFNPYHDELGRFTDAESAAAMAANPIDVGKLRTVYDSVMANGGFTYQPVTEQSPTEGMAVSPYPERSFATPIEEFSFIDLAEYAIRNRDLLANNDHFMGGWVDKDSGKVFLDVSIVTKTREEAYKLCKEKDQKAFFDLGTFEEIEVDKNATSGGVA